MGKNAAKIILPALAIGGLAVATGGFGLFGAGAAAEAGTAAALGAGEAAAATGIEAASMAAMENAVTVYGGETLASGALIPTTEAASSGFFSGLVGKAGSGALLSYGEAAGLGLSGVGSVASGMSASAQADADMAALETQRLGIELETTNREVQSQSALARTLASQQVVLGAQGRDAGNPTSLRLASAAQADAESGLLSTQSDYASSMAQLGQATRQAGAAKRGAMVGSLLSLGRDGWSILSRRV